MEAEITTMAEIMVVVVGETTVAVEEEEDMGAMVAEITVAEVEATVTRWEVTTEEEEEVEAMGVVATETTEIMVVVEEVGH